MKILQGTDEDPLGSGVRVAVADAETAIDRCDACLSFDRDGASAIKNIESSWVEYGSGQIGFVFADGTVVILTPDDRSGTEYVKGTPSQVFDMGFEIIDFQGTKALAKGESENGPASGSWVGNGYLWQVIGAGGAGIEDVSALAADL